jgi:hypothetical protein
MRSPKEIAFRIQQEIANLALYLRPPAPRLETPWPLALPPKPEARRADLADAIERGRFPLLGGELNCGGPPNGGYAMRWRKDYFHGIETPAEYFRRIRYLDFGEVGDHKAVWEPNRHQQLVALAMEGRIRSLTEALESWLEQNPLHRGVNWTSALEVAFRALSWIWIWHYAGPQLPPGLRERFCVALWQHGRHLQANLSIYFSPNTHLLGEGVALHALGVLFPSWPKAAEWRRRGFAQRRGRDIVRDCIKWQVREDGSYFEQSSYYHVYGLDFFLFHHILEAGGRAYEDKLRAMALYLNALMGPSRSLPYLGDDDGGRVFDAFGDRREFGRGTLAACAQLFPDLPVGFAAEDLFPMALCWLGAARCTTPARERPPLGAQRFRPSGVVSLEDGGRHLIFLGGGWGPGSAGHSHADALHFVARRDGREVFRDPGTGTYASDAAVRDWFRGPEAHNAIRVNGEGQARPAGLFRWENLAEVEAPTCEREGSVWRVEGRWRRRGFAQRRVLRWDPAARRLSVEDRLEGPPGKAKLEVFWQCDEEPLEGWTACRRQGLAVERIKAWKSEALGSWEEVEAWRVSGEVNLPWEGTVEWTF